MKPRHLVRMTVALASAGLVAACVAQKSANPLSPSVAGPIPGVGITAPALVSPGSGSRIDVNDQPLSLTIGNSTTTGVRPLSYHFQLASDSGFGQVLFDRVGITPGNNGSTTVKLPDTYASGTYYWRARAEDGANMSDYAGAVSFTLYMPVVLQAPVPVSPANGASVSDTTVSLVFQNASRTGPAGQITYNIQYGTDSSFAGASSVSQTEQSGQTSVSISGLSNQTTYYWRVEATDPASSTTGPWSSTMSFQTPAPASSGSSGGSGSGGGTSSGNASSAQYSESQWKTIILDAAQGLNPESSTAMIDLQNKLRAEGYDTSVLNKNGSPSDHKAWLNGAEWSWISSKDFQPGTYKFDPYIQLPYDGSGWTSCGVPNSLAGSWPCPSW